MRTGSKNLRVSRAKGSRGDTVLLFKYLHKVIVVRVSHIVADFLDGQFGVSQQLCGMSTAHAGYIFRYGGSGLLFKGFGQMGIGEMNHISQI